MLAASQHPTYTLQIQFVAKTPIRLCPICSTLLVSYTSQKYLCWLFSIRLIYWIIVLLLSGWLISMFLMKHLQNKRITLPHSVAACLSFSKNSTNKSHLLVSPPPRKKVSNTFSLNLISYSKITTRLFCQNWKNWRIKKMLRFSKRMLKQLIKLIWSRWKKI